MERVKEKDRTVTFRPSDAKLINENIGFLEQVKKGLLNELDEGDIKNLVWQIDLMITAKSNSVKVKNRHISPALLNNYDELVEIHGS